MIFERQERVVRFAQSLLFVMAGLVPAIYVFEPKKVVDARHIGERSDAVLRTAMAGHDDEKINPP